MKRLIRYKIKPECVAENEALVAQVFRELHWQQPDGLRYASFKLEDGLSFVHLISFENEAANQAFTALPAFKAFIANIGQRCDERPVNMALSEIGAYGLLLGE